MSLGRCLIWLASAILAFSSLGFFLKAMLRDGGQDAVLWLIGMALGTAGVMTAALMED